MPITVLDVCSKALKRCGEMGTLAADFMTTPQTKAATLLKLFYDDARLEVLRLEPWTCVAKRAPLVADAALTHYTGRTYAFDLPADYVREIDVVDSTGAPVDYLAEQGHIFADTAEPILIYVPDATDPTAWDPLLRETIIINLASKIAYPLTGSHEAETSFASIAQAVSGAASSKSSRERRQGATYPEPWMDGLFPTRRPQ